VPPVVSARHELVAEGHPACLEFLGQPDAVLVRRSQLAVAVRRRARGGRGLRPAEQVVPEDGAERRRGHGAHPHADRLPAAEETVRAVLARSAIALRSSGGGVS
jgi:hypothetical protein